VGLQQRRPMRRASGAGTASAHASGGKAVMNLHRWVCVLGSGKPFGQRVQIKQLGQSPHTQ
jgi:hypothetical protein